jgi:hypothetical protein
LIEFGDLGTGHLFELFRIAAVNDALKKFQRLLVIAIRGKEFSPQRPYFR